MIETKISRMINEVIEIFTGVPMKDILEGVKVCKCPLCTAFNNLAKQTNPEEKINKEPKPIK